VAPKAPEAWLEAIRSLRRQGKLAEAEQSLREFRAAYPEYRLPEDLR
jgi:TolA-binding protein